MTAMEWMRFHGGGIAKAFGTGPIRTSSAPSTPDIDLDFDRLFEFGLARFLDGVEALIVNRGGWGEWFAASLAWTRLRCHR